MHNKIYYICKIIINVYSQMRKVMHQVLEVLELPYAEKLVYLDRITRLYSKFMTYWRASEVRTDGNMVKVKFYRDNRYGGRNYTDRDFPIEELDKRIESYKRKVRLEFSKRHENVRLQREKEIYKWKIFIENAKIQMSE